MKGSWVFAVLAACSIGIAGNAFAQRTSKAGSPADAWRPPKGSVETSRMSCRLCSGDSLLQGNLALSYSRISAASSGASGSVSTFQFAFLMKYGYMLGDAVALGLAVAIGYNYVEELKINEGQGTFQVGPRIAVYLPTGTDVKPYFDFRVGFSHLYLSDTPDGTGVHVNPEVGVLAILKDNLFMTIGVGYMYQYLSFSWGHVNSHSIPMLIGLGGIL